MFPSGIHGAPIGRKSNLKARDDKMVASHRGRDETKLRGCVEPRGAQETENEWERGQKWRWGKVTDILWLQERGGKKRLEWSEDRGTRRLDNASTWKEEMEKGKWRTGDVECVDKNKHLSEWWLNQREQSPSGGSRGWMKKVCTGTKPKSNFINTLPSFYKKHATTMFTSEWANRHF